MPAGSVSSISSRDLPALSPRAEAIAGLEQRLGYEFRDKGLIDRALTHASIGEGARNTKTGRLRDNERLEFLGDRVLGLLTAEALLERDPEAREGDLALRLNAMVNGETCAAVARAMELGDALRLSGGETRTGGREKPSILADACEAVMAAVYLDGGFDAARAIFLKFWTPAFADLQTSRGKDPKTALQEWAQGRGRKLPAYRLVKSEGPPHQPIFTVAVEVEGLAEIEASGASKRHAEAAAATLLLQQIEKGNS